MKTTLTLLAAVLLGLAGAASAQATPGMQGMQMGQGMGNMQMRKVAQGTGVIKAIDTAKGTVTIQHQAIASIHWPAMTMTFKAGNTDISSIKQGDQVTFEFISTGMDGTLTKVTRR